jgi:tight adherence protein B
VPLTAGEFILLTAILLGVGVILSILMHNIFLFMMLIAAVIWGPRAWISARRAKRTRDFDAQLPGAIQLIASALRSGGSNIALALRMAAQQSKPPISKEFQIVVQQIEWGSSIKDALVSMTERVPSIDLQLLVQAIAIQMESGGNLVQMLENISDTIRERVRLAGEVKALTAQGKYSGYVVALMPVVISGLLFIFNPNYILGVFRTTQWCGWTMFTLAGIMIVIGMAVIRRVVDIKA